MPHPHPPIANLIAAWEFVRWVDRRLLTAARSVPTEAEYLRDRGMSHGSVHAVLLHMMNGQAGWLQAFGVAPGGLPDTSAGACPNLAAIERTWPIVHGAIATFLSNLKPPDLDRPIRFTRRGHELALPLSATITHVIDHAGYHRGQLNTLIKLAGGQPVAVSYWIYATRLHPQPSGATDADFM